MKNQIKYVLMKSGEEAQVIEIVLSVFNEFVAPQFSEEGIAEFLKYTNDEALAKRNLSNHFTIIAKQNNNPVGIIEIRDYNHISLFFIKKDYQNMGIGKNLLQHAVELCLKKYPKLKNLTVNASPNAVQAYKKMGFDFSNGEQCINGIRFTPMIIDLYRSCRGS